MATRLYRTNPEEPTNAVTQAVGAATTKLVEITVDCSTTGVGGARVIAREEFLKCLKNVEEYVLQNPWPPV